MDYLKISNQKVRAATGKNWNELFVLLDKWNAKKHGHKATAKYLQEQYNLSGWWSQVVTIRYEKEQGYWQKSY